MDRPSHATGPLAALSAVIGVDLIHAAKMASGDTGATWRMITTVGTFVVRSEARAGDARRWAHAAIVVAAAGVPAPQARVVEADGTTWLVMDDVQGDSGASWLDTPDRSRALARSMGTVWRRLQAVDFRGIRPRSSMTRSAPPGFVHGDFAPINVIVDDDGAVVGLLDFEHAHVGDPLEDVAWWGWVVRHHHPAAWEAAWPSLGAAAELDVVELASTLRMLMLRQLQRRARAAADERDRARWRGYLDEASAW